MKKELKTPAGTIVPGTRIRIDRMKCETTPSAAFPDGIDHHARALDRKKGTVLLIDDAGQLHGTWGGLAVQPDRDRFTVLTA